MQQDVWDEFGSDHCLATGGIIGDIQCGCLVRAGDIVPSLAKPPECQRAPQLARQRL